MKTEKIIKPSCIVDFNNDAEVDVALNEALNDTSEFISFEEMYKKTSKHLETLTIN